MFRLGVLGSAGCCGRGLRVGGWHWSWRQHLWHLLLRACFGHDDLIQLKYLPRYWPFVRGIHWSSVNSPHKVKWHGASMFSLICAWINGWVNTREAGDLRRYRAHYDDTVMQTVSRVGSRGDGWSNFCVSVLLYLLGNHDLSGGKINTLEPPRNGQHSQMTFSNVFSLKKMFEFRL